MSTIAKVIIAVIITALIAGGLAWYFARSNCDDRVQNLQNTIDEKNAEIERLQSQEMQDQPDQNQTINQNWETYDSNQGFSIRYPADWQLTTETTEGIAVITNFDYPSDTGSELTGNQTKRVFTIVDNIERRSPREINNVFISDPNQVQDIEIIRTINTSAIKMMLETNLGMVNRVLFLDSDRVIVMNVFGNDQQLNEMIESFKLQNN